MEDIEMSNVETQSIPLEMSNVETGPLRSTRYSLLTPYQKG